MSNLKNNAFKCDLYWCIIDEKEIITSSQLVLLTGQDRAYGPQLN